MSTITDQIKTEVTERILEAMDAPDLGTWRQSWSASNNGGMPLRENGIPYKGINVLLLLIEQANKGYNAPNWFTYKGAQKHGGQVRKGQTGTRIIYWNIIKKIDDATGLEKQFAMLKTYKVFNANQCDGLERFEAQPVELSSIERIKHCDEFMSPIPANLVHQEQQAFYSPSHDFVNMPKFESFESAEMYYSVLSHELVHWTKHKTRLDRQFKNNLEDGNAYAREELVAELGAAFVCNHLGIEQDTRDDHAKYLKAWRDILKADNDAIFKAAKYASEAANFLIDYSQEPAQEQGVDPDVKPAYTLPLYL